MQVSVKCGKLSGNGHRQALCSIKSCLIVILLAVYLLACGTTEPGDDNREGNLPDTTTQNFTFEEFEWGNGVESNSFEDVWIFDENNIWAVGYFGETDSTPVSNVMRYDGTRWRVMDYYVNTSGIYGIHGLDSSNIFFAVGAAVQYKNGQFIEHDMGHLGFSRGQSVEHIWGSSEDNIWGVGPNGTVVHYNGSEWKKIDIST